VESLVTFGHVDVPPFPGTARIDSTKGDWDNFHANACSRPPLPTSRTRIGSIVASDETTDQDFVEFDGSKIDRTIKDVHKSNEAKQL
jgi:hypothetical protein